MIELEVHGRRPRLRLRADAVGVETALAPGETLFVFSDGVTEAMNASREFYGEARLERLLAGCPGRASEEVIGSVVASVAAFVGEFARSDDITAMAIRLP